MEIFGAVSQEYSVWDKFLNEVYQDLKEHLPEKRI